MQFITCHSGKLQSMLAEHLPLAQRRAGFTTGLSEVDRLAPNHTFARGAVHELLSPTPTFHPLTWATWLAHRAASVNESRIGNRQSAIQNPLLFLDPARTLYPPALAALGIDLHGVYLLRPGTRDEGLWAMAECLRCPGVGAVVAGMDDLSRLEARRLQLAAEDGGTVAILMRPAAKADIYAAATRWRVEPARGERTVRRWRIQLVHGHGGRVGQGAYVEQLRDPTATTTNPLRATPLVADRPRLPASTVRSA